MASHDYHNTDFLMTRESDRALFNHDSGDDTELANYGEDINMSPAQAQDTYAFHPDPNSVLHADRSVVLGKRRSDGTETIVDAYRPDLVLASGSSLDGPRVDIAVKRRHVVHKVSGWRPTSRSRHSHVALTNQFRVQEKIMAKQAAMLQQTQDTLNIMHSSQQQMVAERVSLLNRMSRLEAEKETIQAQKELEMSALVQKTNRSPSGNNSSEPADRSQPASLDPSAALPPSISSTDPSMSNGAMSVDPPGPATIAANVDLDQTGPQRKRPTWKEIKSKRQRKEFEQKKRTIQLQVTPRSIPGDSEMEEDEPSGSDDDEGYKGEGDDRGEADDMDGEDTGRISKKDMKEIIEVAIATAFRQYGTPQKAGRKKNKGIEKRKRQINALHAEKLADTREERNSFCGHVRLLFEEVFGFEKEEDYAAHEPPSPSTIDSFEKSFGPGPNLDDLRIDMLGKISSEWNARVAEVLLEKFLEYKANWEGTNLTLPERSDAYFLDLITDKLGRVKTEWGRTRARFKPDGLVETPSEVEARMEKDKDERGETTRAYSRRVQKYDQRMRTIRRIIEIKKAEGADDLDIWMWIQTVIQKLGEEGTSSDESGVDEETGYAVFNVRKMPWRRDIEKLLKAIRHGEAIANASRDKRGAKPAHRIRTDMNLNSRRSPKKELPRPLYDPKWLKEQNKYVFSNLRVSKEKLPWIELQDPRRRS